MDDKKMNIDILDTISNLSSNEVFTPLKVVNQMLDLLPKEVWNENTKFLDPCCKTGIFLREITRRLMDVECPGYKEKQEDIRQRVLNELIKYDIGESEFYDKQQEVYDSVLTDEDRDFLDKRNNAIDHILHEQVYGIGITTITAMMSRRTVYCDRFACDTPQRKSRSISKFDNPDGNIKFVNIEHDCNKDGKCKYCGVDGEKYNSDSEHYAYNFIHQDITEIFKDIKDVKNMKFDVIIGNPPYQMQDNDGTANNSASPIYHKFIDAAIKLNPKYLVMITPSKWMVGGKVPDDFRLRFINCHKIKELHHFANAKECFSNNDIKGSVSYFLYETNYFGKCKFVEHNKHNEIIVNRDLSENKTYIIPSNVLNNIVNKVQSKATGFVKVSVRNPYGFITDTFTSETRQIEYRDKYGITISDIQDNVHTIACLGKNGKRVIKYVNKPIKQANLNNYKIFIPKSSTNITNNIVIGKPNMCCTETFLEFGPFENETIANNAKTYLTTKFVNALFLSKKMTPAVSTQTFSNIPLEDFSKVWTDEELYKKYNLSQDEIDFIETEVPDMLSTIG